MASAQHGEILNALLRALVILMAAIAEISGAPPLDVNTLRKRKFSRTFRCRPYRSGAMVITIGLAIIRTSCAAFIQYRVAHATQPGGRYG